MHIELGEWLPDLPAHRNKGALVADNVIPGITGAYSPVRGFQGFATAVAGKPVGTTWARSRDAAIFNIVGTAAGLFQLDESSITDLTQAGGYAVDAWDFTLFGNRLIAAGGVDQAMQFYDLDSAGSVNFEDLAGSPPNAKYIGICRDFLIGGNVRVGGVHEQDTMAWSGFNNSEIWTRSIATQSDRQALRGRGGSIQRVISGDVAWIFQEQSVWRQEYAGPPIVFRFDEIHTQRGTPSPWSVVRTGNLLFFYSDDGFYQINTRSGEMTPIGGNRVDRYFSRTVSPGEIPNMRAVIDRRQRFVMWAYSTAAGAAFFDSYIAFNWVSNRWSGGKINTTLLGEFASGSVTLDDLDTILGHGVDGSATFSVDSDAFTDGIVGLLVFDETFQPGTFSGPVLPAVIDTAEFSQEDRILFVNKVRPLVEGGGTATTITPITRNRLQDNPVIGSPSALNGIGVCDVRVNARYHRYRMSITDNFEHATAVEIKPKSTSKR